MWAGRWWRCGCEPSPRGVLSRGHTLNRYGRSLRPCEVGSQPPRPSRELSINHLVDGGAREADNPPVLILARDEVEAALDRDRLVDAVGAAMAELSSGEASVPARTAASVAAVGGALLAMPAYVPG